jgi:hypothetical protein
MAEDLVGLLAEFPTQQALVEAAKRVRTEGYRCIDAYSPYPIESLPKVLGIRTHTMGWLSLLGGLFGFFGTLAVQVFINWNYPIDVGGRPLLAWPAFAVVDFELMVLFSVIFPVVGMLYLNGLPRIHHPLFGTPRLSLASDDRFFLYVEAADPKFDPDRTREFLASLGPATVQPVLA